MVYGSLFRVVYCSLSIYHTMQSCGSEGTKSPVIGRYERDEMKPSIDTATKLASFLEVSLDYLVGKTDLEIDSITLNRILEVQQLPNDLKDKLFYFIDMSIRDFKAKKAYS